MRTSDREEKSPSSVCVCVCDICPVVTTTEGLSVRPHNWKPSQCLGRYDDIIRFTFTSSTHRPSAFTPGAGDLWTDGSDRGAKFNWKYNRLVLSPLKVDFQLFLHPFLVILCVLLSLYTPISRFKPFFRYFASLFSRSTYKILFVVVLSLLTSHCSHFAFLLNSFASLLGSHLVSICLLAGLLVTMKGFLWQLGLKMGLSPE